MHIYSTLITAQDVVNKMTDEKNIDIFINWCKATNVTRAYVEVFRGEKAFAEVSLLKHIKARLEEAEIDVRGCVTTVELGKQTTGWAVLACYTAEKSRDIVKKVFERAAEVFDIVMIDDFLFTDCKCDECTAAKGDRSWGDYRSELMMNLSLNYILKPAKAVNPNVKIIIKYPNWFDTYYVQGYDVVRETEIFDMIWAGNETREPEDSNWGKYPQYLACYVQTWLNEVGGAKCGGGWYDSIATKPETYLEQARQTILGRAKESMLFCYSGLTGDKFGKDDTLALRGEMSGLLELDSLIDGYKLIGIDGAKKPDVDAGGPERNYYPFSGMIGLPLIGRTVLDDEAKSAYLGRQAAEFWNICEHIEALRAKKTPFAVSSELMKAIADKLPESELTEAWKECGAEGTYVKFVGDNIAIVHTASDLWELCGLPQADLDKLRNMLLAPFGIELYAPSRVSLHLFGECCKVREVVENFNNTEVKAVLKIKTRAYELRRSLKLSLPADSAVVEETVPGTFEITLKPRSLAVI